MSYDLERATERAIDRLRGIAMARRVPIIGPISAETLEASEAWIAQALDEIAASLEAPLDAIEQARQREAERRSSR